MYEEIISNLEEIIDFIIPSEEEINIVVNKLNNDEALDFYDSIVLNKIRFLNLIIKNRGGKLWKILFWGVL